jgi:hypothetical protein
MTLVGLGIVLVALIVGLLTMLRAPRRSTGPDDRDTEVLEAAEREVRDLGALKSPEDAADELDDWGPGAPK